MKKIRTKLLMAFLVMIVPLLITGLFFFVFISHDLQKRAQISMLLVIAAALILAILLELIFSDFIVKPIEILKQASEKMSSGDLSQKISIKSKDEIGQLAESFNEMAEKLKDSMKNIEGKVAERTRELEKMKAQDDALLESIGDGVIATDKNSIILFINKAAIEMLGLEKTDYAGKMLIDYVKMKDELGKEIIKEARPMIRATKERKKIFSREFNYQRINGILFPVALTVTPIITNNKILGTIEVFRDITKEKEIDKAKTEFVSLASHQLRTPLSAINWYSEMLLAGDAGEISEEQKKFLDEIYSSNQRMVGLVNALLNVSRIELGTLAIDPELTDFAEIAKSVIAELKNEIIAKKLNVTEDYDATLPKIFADPKLIRIIFQNFLSNAVKYTPEKGRIAVSIQREEDNVLIKISDTGYGIPDSQKGRIFEKLFRADNVREKDASGSGLGLYLVKSIVESSRGKIWFESKEDEGTIFFVMFPLLGMEKREGSKTLNI